ncbi:VOC family protein [Streptomyces aurantiacus]|uniref:Putative 27 kDa antigen Cfp30B n=1 Tax=Streptomyces aurantiacus JA 4570 TaxID=1286094 RepID=S3Z9Y6_9ACTN|nr:VOC family protein [Streptomyces aurantiacus]EPH39399.1 putative 27 kDa antigen Cfp30B [Streptomyces aurantiacus JA 4570]
MLSTDFVPGAPNWLDLGVPDTDAAVSFYSATFGWQFQSAGPDGGGYGFFLQDDKTVAGLGPLTEEGASAAWTLYFHTPDADATAKAVEQAGGTVRMAPDDVFSFGRMGQFTDPAGADFAVWQPGDIKGVGLVNTPNSLTWAELYTTDAAGAKDFYRAVFSWQTTDMEMGPDMTYTVLTPAGGTEENSHGGLMQLPQENLDRGSRPEWHPYFEVADCDAVFARATEAGGTTLIPPADAEGIGRLAMLLDPAGAPFAIIKSAGSEQS